MGTLTGLLLSFHRTHVLLSLDYIAQTQDLDLLLHLAVHILSLATISHGTVLETLLVMIKALMLRLTSMLFVGLWLACFRFRPSYML